nr:MAG TPA: hypothetical protein [Caudoviricetes sp.]
MESIKKQGLRDLISKHERALPTLSNAVEQLRTAGLEISDNVIKDLADNQSAETKSAADRLAREDSKRIRIPYMRSKAIKEANVHLLGVIEDSAKIVQRAVGAGTTNPLELNAFAINGRGRSETRGNGMGGKIARLRRTPTTQSDNRQAGFISQAHR